MSALLLLLGLAFAGSDVVLVLPSETAPESKELQAHLEKTLARSGVKRLDDDAVAHPKAWATAFGARTGECATTLNEAQLSELAALTDKADEVYIALPTSAKPKDTLLWRYMDKKKVVMRVASKAAPLPPASPPAKVVLLPWGEKRFAPETVSAVTDWLGAPAAEVLQTDGSLTDVLMTHPNECRVELEDAVAARIDALAEGVEGDLYIAVHIPPEKNTTFVWRWDSTAKSAVKVYIP